MIELTMKQSLGNAVDRINYLKSEHKKAEENVKRWKNAEDETEKRWCEKEQEKVDLFRRWLCDMYGYEI